MNPMNVYDLIKRIEVTGRSVPFDPTVADSEHGPFCNSLVDIKASEDRVCLVFGDGRGIKAGELKEFLKGLNDEMPVFLVSPDGAICGLNKAYHDAPVLILEGAIDGVGNERSGQE